MIKVSIRKSLRLVGAFIAIGGPLLGAPMAGETPASLVQINQALAEGGAQEQRRRALLREAARGRERE